MLRHFCNGCGEETPVDLLIVVEATWATPEPNEIAAQKRTISVLAKNTSAKADLCPPCVDYLKRFLSENSSNESGASVVEIGMAS